MRDRNISGMAGEFLVAGELSRRGYPVSITMGKAKTVDIHADAQEGKTFRVNVKASRYRTSWPIKVDEEKVDENLYYIFVYLRSEKEISEKKPPEYFIVSAKDIISKKLVTPFKSIPGIKYVDLRDYEGKWGALPKPPT
jgi:hypothetical protein